MEILLITPRFYALSIFKVSPASLDILALPFADEHERLILSPSIPLDVTTLRQVVHVESDAASHLNSHAELRVRREWVARAIQWLKYNNPEFERIGIDKRSLATLPLDGLLEGIHVRERGPGRLQCVIAHHIRILIVHVGYSHASVNFDIMSSWTGEAYLLCFPTLFPRGFGPVESVDDEIEEWSTWILAQDEDIFKKTPAFRFLHQRALDSVRLNNDADRH
ncbi:hypothetical protein Hypma_006700 [Hypsizygus marmoreus]|uniref:DUF6570 domain-containing protein n=1 Tax=Hypsizygus marmoreus TaxID=39966 RepID=A0A369K0H8_HYPMA|nr:hypothetical protein Hypma_006700 [Hypsizygus marmoreus]